jgi:hypothetical protein
MTLLVLMKTALESMGWEIMNHPPCSPDLAPSDIYLFESKKVHLGQTFETDKHEHSVLNWLRSYIKLFMLLSSLTCQDNGKIVLA